MNGIGPRWGTRRLAVATLSLLLVGLAACSDPLGPQVEQLEQSRELWESHGIADYRYRYQRFCFCPPEVVEPVIIEVNGGEVLTVTRPEGEATPPDTMTERQYPTIDDLFDELRAAIDQGAAVVDVTYHPTLGYPASASIDFSVNVIDEETGFTVTELVIFDPLAGSALTSRR